MHRTLAAALLAVLALQAGADEIETKGGATYSGRIVSEDDKAVTIETAALGRMPIARNDIVRIQRDGKAPETPKVTPPDAAGKPKDAAPAPGRPDEAPKPDDVKSAPAKPADDESLSAEDRDARRKASKIVRKTAPQPAKAAEKAAPAAADPSSPAAPGAAPQPAAKPTFGGAQLAQAQRGAWMILFEPPKQLERAPSGIQIGHRSFARLDSAGVASAWLTLPYASGEKRVPISLAQVQRHIVVAPNAPRSRLFEGIDKGSWVRLTLDDETTVQGPLEVAREGAVSLLALKADGTSGKLDVPEEKIVEVDGLMRSTATRLLLSEASTGEQIALTLWPECREILGVLKERTDKLITIEALDGSVVQVPVEGPIADVRRVPAKWRQICTGILPDTLLRARSAEDFADSRVERNVIGTVVACTAYALCLSTNDGVLALPFESITDLGAVQDDREAAAAKAAAKSDHVCQVPVMPGAPAAQAKELDPAAGLSAVTDGKVVTSVFVTAPFGGEVFGIALGNRVSDVTEHSDLRFDTVVVPRRLGDQEPRPTEMLSNSLEGVRVSLLLDAIGTVSAIEITAR